MPSFADLERIQNMERFIGHLSEKIETIENILIENDLMPSEEKEAFDKKQV